MIRLVSSNINLLDFYYTKDIDYYILNVILSEPLGSSILTVEQIDGPTVYLEKISSTVFRFKDPFDETEVSRTFRATLETEEDSNNPREKTYKIPIHRKVAEATLLKETVNNSLLYLDIKKEKNYEINKDYDAIIYNIVRTEKSLDIYSNTLNISITDKFIENTGLYFYKTFSNQEDLKDFKNKLTIYKEEDLTLFFNEEVNESFNKYCYIGNPLNRSSNIKVRKLKDRFKITIKDIDGLQAKVLLRSSYIFEPTSFKNFIEFNEFILNINKTQYYVYNNSFNILNKKEYSLINETKDPLIELNSFENNIISYKSWRSNLLFNEKLESNYYYYLNLESENKTNLIVQTVEKQDNPSLLFMFSQTHKQLASKITWTPFSETVNYIPLGENYTLVNETVLDRKFNHYNDIKFSTERLLTSIERDIKNKTIYLIDGEDIIYQSNKMDSKEVPPSPIISCAGATDSTSCIEFSDDGLFDVYINNMDTPYLTNATPEQIASLEHIFLQVHQCQNDTEISCEGATFLASLGFPLEASQAEEYQLKINGVLVHVGKLLDGDVYDNVGISYGSDFIEFFNKSTSMGFKTIEISSLREDDLKYLFKPIPQESGNETILFENELDGFYSKASFCLSESVQ